MQSPNYKYTCFKVSISNGVAELVLSRPEKLNTMTPTFFDELGRVYKQLNEDDQVNVILTWAEGRIFTAGLDLKEAAGILSTDNSVSKAEQNVLFYKRLKVLQRNFERIRRNKKPVIAAIHGQCIGGGVDLITAADIRIATQDASFSIAETRIALVADIGTLQRISRIVGPGMAREMAFTADKIDAQRAKETHLVNSVYENKEKMLEAGRELAKKIASLSPLVVQGTKMVLNYSEEHNIKDSLEHVALWNSAFIQSTDLGEAMSAFMERRPGVFKNRL